jgi:hypothetical protein
MILVLGVMIALTPCGICSADAQTNLSQMKSCAVGDMSGMKCCQSSKSKSQSPMCKTMNQSSVAAAVHGLDLAVVPVVSLAVENIFLSAKTLVSFASIYSFASLLRRSLSLRI